MSGNRLLFIRAKRQISASEFERVPLYGSARNSNFLESNEITVWKIPTWIKDSEIERYAFGESRPEWIDFAEALEIGADAWHGPGHEDDDGHLYKSAGAALMPELVGMGERPAFGKKIFLLSFVDGAEDRDINRLCERFSRRLGGATQSWHGELFRAFAFIDTRSADAVALGLEQYWDDEIVQDCFLAQPIRIVSFDTSGLSPLQSWITAATARPRRT